MKFRVPVRIEKLDEQTEKWQPYINPIRVNINKNASSTGKVYLSAGSIIAKRELVFSTRYQEALKEIAQNKQLFRIIYDGVPYNIADYDDFEERHLTVKMLGVFL